MAQEHRNLQLAVDNLASHQQADPPWPLTNLKCIVTQTHGFDKTEVRQGLERIVSTDLCRREQCFMGSETV